MTKNKKILLWIILILLFNILSPMFYWLYMKHRKAFWVCVILLYLVGFGIMGTAFYEMSTGHHDKASTESVMAADAADEDDLPFGSAEGNAYSEEEGEGGDDDGEQRHKRNPDDAPTDIRELAEWLCVPYTEEDCVPRMGVTYKDTDIGYFKYRFYITGGKNDTEFGQAQWHLHLRTKGLVTLTLKSLGHSIYQLNSAESGALAGWIFFDHDGERMLLINANDETEYTIVDEELEAEPDGLPEPAPKYGEK